ncbi:hypothetical protein T07_1973 [Trichinella nelsoni]|uniref:Uncharacterized protein n=1 Tax=Trichinella nelsoni TaxID=6336 RepID=A0A0V0RVY4_9BILA|nr:hypothetical protein T07_1973 [Trichinella nelsoni]
MRRRVLTKSLLNFHIEQCISPVHIVLRHRKKSENGVDAKRNADSIMQNNKREKRKNMNNEEKKKRKQGPLVEQIADGTKQNKKRQKVYAVPRGSQFCKSGLGILRKGEVIP